MGLLLVKRLRTYNVNGKELLKTEYIFDKSSDRIEKLVNKTGYVDILDFKHSYMTTDLSSNYILNTYVTHMV